jgi:hypothetical protein
MGTAPEISAGASNPACEGLGVPRHTGAERICITDGECRPIKEAQIWIFKLLDRYIREEIYLREGQALHLGQEDEIVRRRIVQKYEFLQSDLTAPDSPSPGMLERWFEQNKLRYLSPDRVAFAHIYFSADQGRDTTAKARALRALKKLRQSDVSRAPALGDVPFRCRCTGTGRSCQALLGNRSFPGNSLKPRWGSGGVPIVPVTAGISTMSQDIHHPYFHRWRTSATEF